MRRIYIVLFILCMFVSDAAAATNSMGEITITVVESDLSVVRNAIVSVLASTATVSIKEASDYFFVFEAPAPESFATFFFTGFGGGRAYPPVLRFFYTVVPAGGNTIIKSRAVIVLNAGSRVEEESPLRGKADITTMQNLLETIKSKIEPGYEPQIIPVGKQKAKENEVMDKPLEIGWELREAYVLEVKKESIAEMATLQAGDVITEINLAPTADIGDINKFVLDKLNAGNSVMLVCDRNGELIVVALKKPENQ